MNITHKHFSPSVNIARDFDKPLEYIPTLNAQAVFSQITNDYLLGIRSFNIVGAYGTGKSSFLWAFEKVVNQRKDYFPINSYFQKIEGFDAINLVGDFTSIIGVFAHEFNVTGNYTTSAIIQKIDKVYKTKRAKGKGLIVFIDEFGKYLEYAAKNNPEQELYFIQQLAEYVNDVEKEIFLISTLHQDFSSYSYGLTKSQRNEWNKVKGRIKDVTFNEPVEQLLFLASERLNRLSDKKVPKTLSKLLEAIESSKAFPLRDYLNEEIAIRLFPFDILAASILALSLQKYGQNERSLFSFIEAKDHLSIQEFDYETPFYNIASVYDYLIQNHPILSTRYNPHSSQWGAIKMAIERVEGLFEKNVREVLRLIKTIGLLNIFASASAQIDEEFLYEYSKLSLGIKDTQSILEQLKNFKIIRYVRHSNKFILFEGTDIDIELEIDKAGNLIEKVTNVVNYLKIYFDFPYVLAKAAYFKVGTPRFFEFKLSETPINGIPKGEIDGFINLIFSKDLDSKDIRETSKKCDEAIIYGWYRNTQEISHSIFEIQKIQKVIDNNKDDKVAVRELNSILQHQIKLLNHFVQGAIYSKNSSIEWYYSGERIYFENEKEFNQVLSKVCYDVYPHTPIYKNEMMNKTKLSSPIATARKNLIRAFVNNWDKEDLGFNPDKFPPEKTIYLSLIKKGGFIHESSDNIKELGFPRNVDFEAIWKDSVLFLDDTKTGRRNLQEFINRLSNKPIKLKRGFIDFWIPIFLFIKKDDFALFEKDVYIPNINDQVLEIVVKNPQKYFIKAFNVEGVSLTLFKKYRALLGQKSEIPSSQSFIQTIKPFLTFYRGLPQYTKNTKRLRKSAINFREAITKAKNPEKTFFEDFPSAFGYNQKQLSEDVDLLDQYIDELYQSLRLIRGAFDDLQERFENYICEFLGVQKIEFEDYHAVLKKRFKHLKHHFLQQNQKVFLQRINSDLDRKSWLSSVCHACIGRTLENIKDTDEPLLYDRFSEFIQDLDNLVEIAKIQKNNVQDTFVSVEILVPNEGKNKRIIRLPKNKKEVLNNKISEIKAILDKDENLNIGVLTQLLNELLINDKG